MSFSFRKLSSDARNEDPHRVSIIRDLTGRYPAPETVDLSKLLDGTSNVCSAVQMQEIRSKFGRGLEALYTADPKRIIALLKLCSKFGIRSEIITAFCTKILPTVDLYDIAYVDRFSNPSLVPLQYAAVIREHVPSLFELRGESVELHLLAGSVIGFRVGAHEWRISEKVVLG